MSTSFSAVSELIALLNGLGIELVECNVLASERGRCNKRVATDRVEVVGRVQNPFVVFTEFGAGDFISMLRAEHTSVMDVQTWIFASIPPPRCFVSTLPVTTVSQPSFLNEEKP